MTIDKRLEINPQEVQSSIVNYIQTVLKERDINGLVVLYRDCIESLINVKLATQIVGVDNIKLVVTHGRFSSSEPTRGSDLKIIKKYLNLPKSNIVFSNLEEAVNAINNLSFDKTKKRYGFTQPRKLNIFNYNLSYGLLRGMANEEIEEKSFTPTHALPVTERELFVQKAIAYHKSQIRLHMLLAFLVAETESKSFIGSVNKTEWLLGLFTKFGTYHAADFLPLAGLYRTQTIKLGEYLSLGDYLDSKKRKSPTSYNYFFNLSYKDVDRALIRLEDGMALQDISNETKIPINSLEKINHNYQASVYARSVPLIPDISKK
jgi:NH3-dependent NAD+ synthetase